MATSDPTRSAVLYGPMKIFSDIGSYELETQSLFQVAAVSSVNLTALKAYLNTKSDFIKKINSEEPFKDIDVGYLPTTHGVIITARFGTAAPFPYVTLLQLTRSPYTDLAAEVLATTGIALVSTEPTSPAATYISLNDITYSYVTRHVSKFYGPVNALSEKCTKLYGSANGATKLIQVG